MPKKNEGKGGDPEDPSQIPQPRDAEGKLSILVEMVASAGMSPMGATTGIRGFSSDSFEIDEKFIPVPMHGPEGAGLGMMGGTGDTYVVRARVDDESAIEELLDRPDVANVWKDTPIAPFACPIPPCDCSPGTPKGNMADVANYLGVSSIWEEGVKGAGIVVGVVDGGITAQGRPVIAGETTKRIPRVIGGWPEADWGTQASAWGEHGNMCSTDVLGMAPESHIYDLRIAASGPVSATISRALQAFQWAIDRHKADGTPHILSNSWGIFQEAWDTSYAHNANHPFTRKVVEAIDEGIIILFAAGNCGGTCADGRCGADKGPGRSIWGANGHPRVMTVGAVNKNEQFVGYSSQGPASLDANKPDFCSVTHFTGYHNSDSGTSAATPILAGAVALIKQAVPAATQDGIKGALKATAKDIGPAGFDQHSGAGIVRPKGALDRLRTGIIRPSLAVVCQPSRLIACQKPSVTTVCKPSLVTICKPSLVTICGPSVTAVCPPSAIPATCPKPSLATCPPSLAYCPRPSLACPSMSAAMCTPLPRRAGQGMASEPTADPAMEGWYDFSADPDDLEGEEYWS